MRKTVERKEWDKAYFTTKNILLKISQNTGAILLHPESILCTTEDCLVCTPDSSPIYKDGCHLRATYVRDQLTFLDFLFIK